MSNFKCPHCGSENIQKCSVIYHSGTTSNQSTTKINGNVEAETSGVRACLQSDKEKKIG